MKKITSILLSAIMLFSLFSCSGYKSSYNATMLVRTSGGDHCGAEFNTLDGTLVLNARANDDDMDGYIHYEAELEEGEARVYYDTEGTKELLFTIYGGEKLDGKGGKVTKGDKVTIIIETVETVKNGDIEIDFD